MHPAARRIVRSQATSRSGSSHSTRPAPTPSKHSYVADAFVTPRASSELKHSCGASLGRSMLASLGDDGRSSLPRGGIITRLRERAEVS
jgi:hypothetical protein